VSEVLECLVEEFELDFIAIWNHYMFLNRSIEISFMVPHVVHLH
jgi:hypothetical protein